jgi:hypothetical protein
MPIILALRRQKDHKSTLGYTATFGKEKKRKGKSLLVVIKIKGRSVLKCLSINRE